MAALVSPVVGVLGGCGGAGASVLAAALAARGAGAQEWPVLLDLDVLGGGIDVILGAENVPGARWSGLHAHGDRLDPDQLADGLPRWGQVPFLAIDSDLAPSPESVRSVLAAAGQLGPVVVDLGRWSTPARAAAIEMADSIVLLVPTEIRAVTAASALRTVVASETGFRGLWQLVVRLDRPVLSAARIAEVLQLPLAGSVAEDRGLACARDRGVDVRRLRRSTVALARCLLDAVAEGPATGPRSDAGGATHESLGACGATHESLGR